MKLVILGVEHDSSKELEVFATNENGFKATIVMSERGRNDYHFSSEVRHNLTEIHHLYDIDNPYSSGRIAFESDLHCTGGTLEVEDIESVTVEIATDMNESYYGDVMPI